MHLVQSYYAKAKLLGLEELFLEYDRYAPLPSAQSHYDFETSKRIVLEAFERFNPRFHEIATLAFDEKWIDVIQKIKT